MKHRWFPLALATLSCAPAALTPPRPPAAPPRGEVSTVGRYDRAIAAGSLWVDRTGAVYVTDRSRWRVLSYGCTGDSCVLRFELPLDAPGMFLVPGHDGGCCLADGIGRRLLFYSSQGEPTGALAVAGSAVDAAAIDAAGEVFVLDETLRTVVVYDRRGDLLRRFPLTGGGRDNPTALAVSRSGGLVAVTGEGSGGTVIYSGYGRRLAVHPGAARQLAFDASDRIWSIDKSGRISIRQALHPERGSQWPDSSVRFAAGAVMAVAATDEAWVAGGGAIQRCR
ncbi:MAG: hypothetical protein MUF78_02855 [Candidatus Edwardsbacteria bacterium]|nr:hypothetical protein [Candidatus Edwardsbacteria bacterium]